MGSRLSGLRKLSVADRSEAVSKAAGDADIAALSQGPGLPIHSADGMIENVIGTFELPLGVATNFRVNGQDYLVPMAVEEPSVVAAASNMARLARENGGLSADVDDSIMRGQIQILDIADIEAAKSDLESARDKIIEAANA